MEEVVAMAATEARARFTATVTEVMVEMAEMVAMVVPEVHLHFDVHNVLQIYSRAK
jgi:hypothetical protein